MTVMSSEAPNILIFMTDHGQGAVFQPDHPAITPNAGRLVREGLSFSEAYCPAAHCCPSRATFMTGLFPSRHGVYNNVSNSSAIHRELADGVGTFGEQLAVAGYRMRYCGKWHVSDTKGPRDYGWEERAVTSNRGASKARGEDQWWRGADDGGGDPAKRRPGELLRPGWGYYRLYGAWEDDAERCDRPHPDEAVVDAALESLGDFATGQGPWCLFVGPIGPHDPYIVPRRYRDLYDVDKVELPPSYADVLTDKPNIYRRMREQLWDQLSKEEACDALRHYWAYCTYEDELLGRLLDELDRRGWSDNTLVLLVSDHGDYAGAHGLFLKGVPAFREAYHVPAVVRWPAGIAEAGREVSALVSLADFFPTFVELATGRPVAESVSGASLVPFLRGGGTGAVASSAAEPVQWR